MAQVAEKAPPDFVVSVGDNFYEVGLVSVEDEQFRTSFSDVYWQPSLQVRLGSLNFSHEF